MRNENTECPNALKLLWLTEWSRFLIPSTIKTQEARGSESEGKKHKHDVIFYTKDTDNRISAPAISLSRSLQITCPSERT